MILWNEREDCETQQSFLFEAVKGLRHRHKAYSPTHKHFTLYHLFIVFLPHLKVLRLLVRNHVET